jgi:uncharacterized coiled-coil DUF342 family protein
MNRLNARELAELQQLGLEIRDMLADWGKLCEELRTKSEQLITDLNEKRERAWEIVDDAASAAEAYYDERSEKWQEGEKGERYSEWRDELRRVAGEIEQEFETPELPDLEEPDWVGEIEDPNWAEVSE